MNFGIWDFLVLFAYLGFVLYLGIRAGKNQTSQDFFLGNRNLPWYLILFSIVATETSSLTFLNIPGLSYKTNFAFLQVAFGYILGRIFVAYVLLPMYFRLGYVSVYQWVGESFGEKAQRYASSAFVLTRVLGDGIRLYATSIPVAILLRGFISQSVSDTELYIFILFIISFITVLYTVYGGFKAVVWTDSFQFLVYLLGGIFSLGYLIYLLNAQGYILSELISEGRTLGKLEIFPGFRGDFFREPYFFINGVIGGTLISIGSHGVDQMFVQRLLACRTEKESKMALIGSGILVFIQFALFLSIGLLLFFFFKKAEIHQDKVFSTFISESIPSPILGLLIAAILASAMSTLSSSINSLSLTYLVDWKFGRSKEESNLSNSQKVSFAWGLVLFFSSLIPLFLTGNISDGLVELGLKISSFTLGPLIGIFFLGRWQFFPRMHLGPNLGSALFAGIVLNLALTYYLKPSLTFVIPMGILSFYFFLGLGIILKRKRNLMK